MRATQREQLRNPNFDIGMGHELLTRLKVSTALALLHGETKISDRS